MMVGINMICTLRQLKYAQQNPLVYVYGKVNYMGDEQMLNNKTVYKYLSVLHFFILLALMH